VELVVGGHEFFEVAVLGILLLAGNRRVKFGDERSSCWIASPRTISSSTACRRKCACCASRTSTRLTTVAYCGKTSTRPSSSSRISASRIGVELTPNWPASAARDSGDPGGSSSEMIMPRRRSNTCGAAWRSRSSRLWNAGLRGGRRFAGEPSGDRPFQKGLASDALIH
jgi:hypothetical protein